MSLTYYQYQAGNDNERGARGYKYNCTPKQAELILKAYKDKGVYLLEPDAAPKPAVVEIAAVTFAPCPLASPPTLKTLSCLKTWAPPTSYRKMQHACANRTPRIRKRKTAFYEK